MFFYDEVEVESKDRWDRPITVTEKRFNPKKLAVFLLVVFLFATVLTNVTFIPTGYTGVRTTFGQIDEDVVENGLCVTIPFVQDVQKVNNKQQEMNFEDQIWGETSERTVVYMADVTITYSINPEYSAWLYANVANYKQNALPRTLVASAMKASMVALESGKVTNRAVIEPLAVRNLQNALNTKYGGNPVITIVSVNINDMDFEASYNQAIADKQIAQMNYEKQQIANQTAVDKAAAEAEKKRIEAEAEADAILAVAEAQAAANEKLSQSINNNLIDYEKIQKWNGQLPTVSGGSAIVSIDG